MEVGYKKDLRHNYMIIEKESDRNDVSFCIKMLEHQEIEGLLPVEQKYMDNKALLYYDITGKQAISNLLEKSALSGAKVKKLCGGIIQTVERAYEYLLLEEDFLLSPEFIYQDIATDSPYLCLLPGYGKCIREQMSTLLEYLMNKVDYNDKDAVYLIYQLYAVSKEDGYTFTQLKDVLWGRAEEKQSMNQCSCDLNIQKADTEERDIPVVMEKVEGEAEVSCYSIKTYLTAGGCILGGVLILIGCIITKILYNPFGNRIDYSKLAALMLILFCLEGYVLNKILDKKNKITKMVKTLEYIDPREDYEPVKKSPPADNEIAKDPAEDEVSSPTCLLNASEERTKIPVLKAQEGTDYKDIPVSSSPFFIGKLKKNVDYCLNNDMVSRYHAKITKEGEHYYLTDLNSTNGTYINRELLQTYQRKEIKFGDEIGLAHIKYQFLLE